jgi:hypothetical protein
LPIEAKTEETKALVTTRTSKKVSEDQIPLVYQTEDRDPFQYREKILGEYFPDEDDCKDDIEDLDLLLCNSLVLVKTLQ